MESHHEADALASEPEEGECSMPIHSIEYMKNAGYPSTTITTIVGCKNKNEVKVTKNGLEIKVLPSRLRNN